MLLRGAFETFQIRWQPVFPGRHRVAIRIPRHRHHDTEATIDEIAGGLIAAEILIVASTRGYLSLLFSITPAVRRVSFTP
jgi:hypothetical protein